MGRRVLWLGAVAALALLASAVAALGAEGPVYTPSIDQDAEVSSGTAPIPAVAGDYALLSSLVTNHGPAYTPITFTDSVPAGLTINATAAGSGTCVTSGQTVACKLSIEPGESAPVNVVVTPAAPGSYVNQVSVAPAAGQLDPLPGNDSAAATLAVASQPAPLCTVPVLRRTPLPVARRVLALLHCRLGKARWLHSRSIPKGMVIRTSPKRGGYASSRSISLTVSSGPRKRA